MDDCVDRLIRGLLILSMALVAGAVLLWFVIAIKDVRGDKITIIKTNWECTQTKEVNRMIMAGKVPILTTSTVCTNYKAIR